MGAAVKIPAPGALRTELYTLTRTARPHQALSYVPFMLAGPVPLHPGPDCHVLSNRCVARVWQMLACVTLIDSSAPRPAIMVPTSCASRSVPRSLPTRNLVATFMAKAMLTAVTLVSSAMTSWRRLMPLLSDNISLSCMIRHTLQVALSEDLQCPCVRSSGLHSIQP